MNAHGPRSGSAPADLLAPLDRFLSQASEAERNYALAENLAVHPWFTCLFTCLFVCLCLVASLCVLYSHVRVQLDVQIDALLSERKIYASTMPMDYLDTCLHYLAVQLDSVLLRRLYMELVTGSGSKLMVRIYSRK